MSKKSLNVHKLLAARHEIAVIWAVDDVQQVRPDLTAAQAWEVLQAVEKAHDANLGISWDMLEISADMLFGDAPEGDSETEEEDA